METDIIGATVAQVQALANAAAASAVAAALPPVSQAAITRPLNSAFQPSTAHDTIVSYSCSVTCTSSIASGQSGDIFLDIATDAAFTQNVQTIAVIGNSQTFTLAVAIQGVQTISGVLSGVIPQSMWGRLRTVNNTGTPTYAYRCGQESSL